MNIEQAVERACQEPTLKEALAWICVWECERVVEKAVRGRTDIETFFGFCIGEVVDAWSRK